MTTYSEPPAVVTGQTMSAANWNAWVVDNFKAVWPFTAGGQIPLSTAANALSKLEASGNSGKIIQSNGTTFAMTAKFYSDLQRQGGNATDWSVPGTTTYTPTGALIQAGVIEWTGSSAASGNKDVTFPVAFSQKPLVFATTGNAVEAAMRVGLITITTVRLYWQSILGGTYTAGVYLQWLAIGLP